MRTNIFIKTKGVVKVLPFYPFTFVHVLFRKLSGRGI